MTLGILPFGRPTVDVLFAKARLTHTLDRLAETGLQIKGSEELLFHANFAREATVRLHGSSQKPGHNAAVILKCDRDETTIILAKCLDDNSSVSVIDLGCAAICRGFMKQVKSKHTKSQSPPGH